MYSVRSAWRSAKIASFVNLVSESMGGLDEKPWFRLLGPLHGNQLR